MDSVRPSIASRASTPLAVRTALAVFVVLALACGMVQDSHAADPETDSGLFGGTTAEDPALEWAKMAAGSVPKRSAGAVMPMAIQRPSPSSPDRVVIVQRPSLGPSQEWMGMSKLVIPLLVADLVGDHTVRAARAMALQAANAGR